MLRDVALLDALQNPQRILAVGSDREMSHPVTHDIGLHKLSFQVSESEFKCKSCKRLMYKFSFSLMVTSAHELC